MNDADATDRDNDLVVVDNPAEARYEARFGRQVVGIAEYELEGERIVFVHTEVDPIVEGRGVGSRLAKGALDDARARGLAVTVECPFIGAWIRRHREYADLVTRTAPGDDAAGDEAGAEAPDR